MYNLLKPPTGRMTGKSSKLAEIEFHDRVLLQHFNKSLALDQSITRSVVSFQANKNKPVYRWYKFKEAFSTSLIEYLFEKYGINKGVVLDPFAGSGTALFVSSELGIDAHGVELLPIGQEIIKTKKILETDFNKEDFKTLEKWINNKTWLKFEPKAEIKELRITKDAYSPQTKELVSRYISAYDKENEKVRIVLRFALLCVLESVSYTRKDGQYLRWDYRSGRNEGTNGFDKGEVLNFESAITDKLRQILYDLKPTSTQEKLFKNKNTQGEIKLFNGSCLRILPTIKSAQYNAIITSPPYCNRYDYTRTYALELALLGIGEEELIRLRQEMLSCTVENRSKDLLDINSSWVTPIKVASNHKLLHAIIIYLEEQKELGKLNNNGIPRMIKGYFYEMACIIFECSRVLKTNGLLFMINDNVRYAGASISVDIILSDFAEKLGLIVDKILVLPNGKGNSSQQMGEHGKESLRKCVYIWRKL